MKSDSESAQKMHLEMFCYWLTLTGKETLPSEKYMLILNNHQVKIFCSIFDQRKHQTGIRCNVDRYF